MGRNQPAKFVTPMDLISAESEEEKSLLVRFASDAEDFITSFSWCRGVQEKYLGNGVGGIVGVFLFHIVPQSPKVDEWLWVIVGDIPPAYLVLDKAKTPSAALKSYIDEMFRWISAVEAGRPTGDLIPVDVSPTAEHASMLRRRLNMLRNELLPRFRQDEAAARSGNDHAD